MYQQTNMVSKKCVVITGISGVFPKSDDVEKFKQNLFSGSEMLTTNTRWDAEEGENRKMGIIEVLDRFDSSFFRISRKNGEAMSISGRILLEKVFEAILDAGYNPQQLKGSNTGVFFASCMDERGNPPTNLTDINQYTILGDLKSGVANRISYSLDLRGPSVALDSACSSSFYALENAYQSIQNGLCDAAIVCSGNICVLPHVNACFRKAEMLSDTGVCRVFDADADGTIRSEALVAIFLQNKEQARRVYANVVNVRTNVDGYKEEGFTYPSKYGQRDLYERLYGELDIDPRRVSYIEAHGTGTRVGDSVEVNTIEDFFCNDRASPLKIGSVKANMGHSEASAGLCSLVKMIISFETGLIPPQVNFKIPHPNIKGFKNGRIEVVTTPTPCDGEYFAVNSYGIGGSNSHVLLTPNDKIKTRRNEDKDEFPRLITVSGRTQEAVEVILNNLEQNCDVEYVRLLHEIFSENIIGHLHRGFIILDTVEGVSKQVGYRAVEEERPIWYVFSGMGSQWTTMGKSLMKIPTFVKSIFQSHQILKTKGIDLLKIITDDDPISLENVLYSSLGIAAIQIALVEILKEINLQPDGMIGHSVGELGCAYVDGCITADQMLLIAYYRSLALIEANLIKGSMAAVGVNYSVIQKFLPSELDIASHNGPNSCTVSGPKHIIKNFIEKAKAKDIFIKEVNSSDIPYHSRYIVSAREKFTSYLREIIPQAKLRSKKWICSSAPKDQWDHDNVKYASVEYFVNNLLNIVYFAEGLQQIPSNAITVEIAPHGLLQAILKRALSQSVDNISLTSNNQKDNAKFLLNALGQIYQCGVSLKLYNLYPTIEFPVSRGTPMISPLIRWLHDDRWSISKTSQFKNCPWGERDVFINVAKKKFNYLKGHNIDDRNLYPAVGYLYLVWEAIASMMGKTNKNVPIVFENVRFQMATNLTKENINFHIFIRKNGEFEVTEDNATVVSGIVRIPDHVNAEKLPMPQLEDEAFNSENMPLVTKEIYKLLRLKGYFYQGLFKKITAANATGTYARISWCDNIVAFMDNMTQLMILQKNFNELVVPTFVRKVVIDVERHYELLKSIDKENPEYPVYYNPKLELLCSGGIQIFSYGVTAIARKKNVSEAVLEKYKFVPYISDEIIDLKSAIRLGVHIALENKPKIKVKTLDIFDQDCNTKVIPSNIITDVLADLPLIQADVSIFAASPISALQNLPNITILQNEIPANKSYLIVIVTNLSSKAHLLPKILNALEDDGFIMTIEPIIFHTKFEEFGFQICFSRISERNERILLLRKSVDTSDHNPIAIKINNTTYSWISGLQEALKTIQETDNNNIIVYAENEPTSGILGLFNCLRKEASGMRTRCFFIMDDNVAAFSLKNPLYRAQYAKNLSHNVYKNGEWGSYRHLQLEPANKVKVPHSYCVQRIRGDLSTLQWIEGWLDPSKKYNEDLFIYVYYSSLNLRDVMIGTRKISFIDTPFYNYFLDSYNGFEYCGRDENGDRYMGMLLYNGLSTIVEGIDIYRTWKIPDHMSFEEAATIPVAYGTVLCSFFLKINLKRGSSVLIHAGTGGVGQAAINVCLHYGCNIFTTVGTPEKVEFIKKTFPQIPESHIGNSRNTTFEIMIKNETNGRGVDVVLNSLSEEKLNASLRCVAKGGHFIEIGKYDMLENNSLEMKPFIKDVTFHSVQLDDLTTISIEERIEFKKKFQHMLDEGIFKPLHRTVFGIDEVEQAMRYMAAGKHMGKVIIKIRDEESKFTKPVQLLFEAQGYLNCDAVNSYVIIGGLGGFGLELAEWLVTRGAKKIILSSRYGVKNGYQWYKLKLWRSHGVTVHISTEDVTTEAGTKNLLKTANSIGPVCAIFNVAVILKDGPFDQQNEETFSISAASKATATIHLDRLSRLMCPNLKYFIVFSSVSCGRGNLHQTNYGMSNSIMERICELRKADNLPALAIQWGAIGEVGILADLAENNSTMVIGGTLQQAMKSCLETMNSFLYQANPIVSSMVVAEKRRVENDIVSTVANILGTKDLKTVNLSWTFVELGMDSMMAIELKQVIESEYGIFMSPQDLKNMTYGELYRIQEENRKS